MTKRTTLTTTTAHRPSNHRSDPRAPAVPPDVPDMGLVGKGRGSGCRMPTPCLVKTLRPSRCRSRATAPFRCPPHRP
eukprot:5871364-Pyramimonas_sp.AAC.1